MSLLDESVGTVPVVKQFSSFAVDEGSGIFLISPPTQFGEKTEIKLTVKHNVYR